MIFDQLKEGEYQNLRDEDAFTVSRNLNAARTFQQLSNDISEESKILDKYRSSCKELRLELAKLRLQKQNQNLLLDNFKIIMKIFLELEN